MLAQTEAENKEKSMVEWLMIIVIIGILMASFLQYFFKQENQLTETGFQALANNFSTQVQAVHGQWMMDGQPNVVLLKEMSGIQTLATVNQHGWVSGDNCYNIWQQVMNLPLEFLKQPISVIEVVKNNVVESTICRFSINEKIYFDYHLLTGKVKSN